MSSDNDIVMKGLGALLALALVISLSIIKRQSDQIRASIGGEVKPRRFRWGIFAVFTILSAAVIAATWLLHPIEYRAHTHIQIGSPFPKIPMQISETPVPRDVQDRFISDLVILLGDENVLRDTLTSTEVAGTDWYRQQSDRTKLLEKLREGFSAEPIPDTNYVRISFATRSAKDAAVIVNTLVDKYLAKIKNMWELQYASELEEFIKQERDLAEKLNLVRHQLLKRKSAKSETQNAGEDATAVAEANLNDEEKWLADELNKIRTYNHQLSMIINDREKIRVHRISPAMTPMSPDHRRQYFLTTLALLLPVLGLVLGYLRAR